MRRGTWATALLVLATGCGAADQQAARSDSATPLPLVATASPTKPPKCCVEPAEPSLKIVVQPSSGPPGTVVSVLITGCGDAAPTDEATVSFNNDSLNVAARNDPNTVRDLGVHPGTHITLPYKIVSADRTGGLGQFFVQCGQTVLETPFKVTG